MSARIYGHDDGNASLEVLRASADTQGVPMTYVSVADDRCMRPRDVYFTPPALRALHTAIGIRLVETDRLQTGRPPRLVRVERDATEITWGDDVAEMADAHRVSEHGREWHWRVRGTSDSDTITCTARTRELAEADVAALLRARGYVVEGG